MIFISPLLTLSAIPAVDYIPIIKTIQFPHQPSCWTLWEYSQHFSHQVLKRRERQFWWYFAQGLLRIRGKGFRECFIGWLCTKDIAHIVNISAFENATCWVSALADSGALRNPYVRLSETLAISVHTRWRTNLRPTEGLERGTKGAPIFRSIHSIHAISITLDDRILFELDSFNFQFLYIFLWAFLMVKPKYSSNPECPNVLHLDTNVVSLAFQKLFLSSTLPSQQMKFRQFPGRSTKHQ